MHSQTRSFLALLAQRLPPARRRAEPWMVGACREIPMVVAPSQAKRPQLQPAEPIRLSEIPALEAAANATAQLPAGVQHDKTRTRATEIIRNFFFRLLAPEGIKIRPSNRSLLSTQWPAFHRLRARARVYWMMCGFYRRSSYLGQLSDLLLATKGGDATTEGGAEMGNRSGDYRLAR